MPVHFDDTGKVSLDHVYTQPDPRAYFGTLRELDYCIPQLAAPYFSKLIKEYRRSQLIDVPQVLDVGCSYGVNAALLKCEATIDELYEHYCAPDARALDRDGLVARDRAFLDSRTQPTAARFVGLDNSAAALAYARSAGFIEAAVHADLETDDPTDHQREQLAASDLVVSTGCLGYVTEKTLARIVRAQGERKPWMAHFVLRMFPFEPVEQTLAEFGYETTRVDGDFKQRRFVSPQEQALVLDTLRDAGVDPRHRESDGWLYAQLYVSRPREAGTPTPHAS